MSRTELWGEGRATLCFQSQGKARHEPESSDLAIRVKRGSATMYVKRSCYFDKTKGTCWVKFKNLVKR
eukprot:2676123-Amphidinium_carterae.1